MREILFRGQRADNDEWVIGYYVQKQDPLLVGVTYHYILTQEKDNCGCLMSTVSWYKVIPETVGQYTGLSDRNSKKIFDGDIVKTQERYDRPYSKNRKSKRHVGVVEYQIRSGSGFYNSETGKWDRYMEYEAEWIVKVQDYGKFTHGSWGDFWDCEVIGNIHDNPELLEVKDAKRID